MCSNPPTSVIILFDHDEFLHIPFLFPCILRKQTVLTPEPHRAAIHKAQMGPQKPGTVAHVLFDLFDPALDCPL